MDADTVVDIEDLVIDTPHPTLGNFVSRPLPRRRAGSTVCRAGEAVWVWGAFDPKVAHTLGEYGGMLIRSTINEKMETNEDLEI
jgi:hypothetical protein